MYLRTCGSVRFANHKNIEPANRKFEKCYICGRSANLTKLFKSASLRTCDLRTEGDSAGTIPIYFKISRAGNSTIKPLYQQRLHVLIEVACTKRGGLYQLRRPVTIGRPVPIETACTNRGGLYQ
jgi:hypothetical protein